MGCPKFNSEDKLCRVCPLKHTCGLCKDTGIVAVPHAYVHPGEKGGHEWSVIGLCPYHSAQHTEEVLAFYKRQAELNPRRRKYFMDRIAAIQTGEAFPHMEIQSVAPEDTPCQFRLRIWVAHERYPAISIEEAVQEYLERIEENGNG